MKNLWKTLLITFGLLTTFMLPSPLFAAEDPLATPNNKIGIHILFPDEINEAANLVNSNGGEWGYVTIPIQSHDRNIEKWQRFMDDSRKLKIIPIMRLATEGDYFNTKVWRKPIFEDVLDFANFLNSLSWPTKNRYITVFNEVNRGDEWGAVANPAEYAEILSYAVATFKSKSQDFFIISAGLDNAAPNSEPQYISSLLYMQRMNEAVPGIFSQIDGLGSHSYPNPGFKSPPTANTQRSISSFKFERNEVQLMGSRELPIFITETGWSTKELPTNTIIEYYKHALENAWSDNKIVAITPFLLRANGTFSEFSFFKEDGSKNELFTYLQSISKTKGLPSPGLQLVENTTLHAANTQPKELITTNASITGKNDREDEILNKSAVSFMKWLLKL